MIESPTIPDLDDPDYWRTFAVRVWDCPFWTSASLAQHEGLDPQRAAAKAAAYLHPSHLTQQ